VLLYPEECERIAANWEFGPEIIKLPTYGITLEVDVNGTSSITSTLRIDGYNGYNDAIDGLESLILAHACAGVNIQSPAYLEGIETAVEAISNHHC